MTDGPESDDDEVLARMGIEWLNQYARFLRRTPDVVARLAADDGDFELIPVPKKLLDRLAVPGIVGSGSLGGSVDADIEELLRIGSGEGPAIGRGEKNDPVPRIALGGYCLKQELQELQTLD